MASSGLPFPTSNNAPLPIPGGYGNPTGTNFGQSTGQPFPVFNQGSFTSGNMGNLSSAFGGSSMPWNQNFYNYLGKAYGKGFGQMLGDLISGKGLYNPQIAAAFLNQQAPGIARGEAGIQSAFGDAGARFSSASALGLGDFESQVQLNQQATLAKLFEHAQDDQLSLLSQVLPTVHQERADEGGTFSKILSGISSVAGMIPGIGTAIKGITGLAGSLFGGHKQGSDTQVAPDNAGATSNLAFPTSNIDLSGMSMSPIGGAGNMDAIAQIIAGLQGSAGDALGGQAFPLDPSQTGFAF